MSICPSANIIKQHFPIFELLGQFHSKKSFDWILPTIAIGDWTSSYQPFDFIINVNYPYHLTADGQIERTVHQGKVIYTVGLSDPATQVELVQELIRQIRREWKMHKSKKFLFHCYDGREKSTSIMIAFLMRAYNMPLSDILDKILIKRAIREPCLTYIL
jgi:protein-tyrosine phosphatase